MHSILYPSNYILKLSKIIVNGSIINLTCILIHVHAIFLKKFCHEINLFESMGNFKSKTFQFILKMVRFGMFIGISTLKYQTQYIQYFPFQ